MGCYPLFCCADWSRLAEDLEELEGELVSLSIVADPFGDHRSHDLRSCFPHHVVPFKPHFVVDLSRPPERFVSRHHLRRARKAAERVQVEPVVSAIAALDRWDRLYEVLIRRHGIEGPRRFSRVAFAAQLEVPGIVVFEAKTEEHSIGMLLWYVRDSIGYYHLGAYDALGYDLGASYALFRFALDYFAATGVRWLTLGGGAGLGRDEGLARFKGGWASETRQVFFCGRVLDAERYAELSGSEASGPYFPAYRRGEFP